MLKVRKSIAMLLAMIMSVAMCTITPVMAAETDKVMFIDFTDTSVQTLPMTTIPVDGETVNAGGRIDKKSEVCYGAAEQSGLWYVGGSSSSLTPYSVADANMNMEKLAECNYFVIRFYSTLETDQFSFVIKSDSASKPYLTKVVDITKSGWQELAVPVSEIVAKLPSGDDITDISTFCLYKGSYSATNFVKGNHIYFDSMWFEKRTSNVVVDADNSSLTLTNTKSTDKISTVTTTVYSDSSKSIQWYSTNKGGHARSVNLAGLGLEDPTVNTKLNFRMYSAAADNISLMVYYYASEADKTNGTTKYVRETYSFSEANGNLNKWVEVALDLTCIDSKDVNLTTAAYELESVRLNRGNWDATNNPPTYNNNVYIDKIWFGEVEDINSTFNYKTSAFDDATNVGVYDTITFEFEDYLGGTIACDAVSVKRDGNAVTEFDAWADRNFLCVKTDTAMGFGSTYEITVTPALKDQRGYDLYGTHTITFKTADPYLAIEDIEIVDASGNKLTAIPAVGTKVFAKADVVNGSGTAQTYTMAIAMYDTNGTLLGVKVSEPKTFDANMTVEHTIAKDDAVVADTAFVRGFLWKGIASMEPAKAAGEL